MHTEAWADVKKPGNGRQYAVGAITVSDTTPGAMYSQAAASAAFGFGFNVGVQQRQVVLLQVTRPDQATAWQRYFYGTTLNNLTRATNARGISVWPAATDADTRIAICGEAYDAELPLSSQAPNPVASPTNPAGFIAVFDGGGTLLWTHHFYSQQLGRDCAITDVSVRVEAGASSPVDVVTYCGISSHDGVVGNQPLSPRLAFPPAGGSSGGATLQNSPLGQWDGIVGRVERDSMAKRVVFHSIVSSPDQDGLFGIAEIDANRFVVVGSTRSSTTGAPTGGFGFPGLAGVNGTYYVGTVLAFDAQPTRTGGNLVLEDTKFVGDFQGLPASSTTHLRDVVVLRDAIPPLHAIAVAGSTDSATAAATLGPVSRPFVGATDGVVGVLLDAAPGLGGLGSLYYGGTGDDGLTGIQGWNEYPDHLVATGFTDSSPAVSMDIGVESFFVRFLGTSSVMSIRSGTIGGTATDRPAVMGPTNATSPGASLPFVTGPTTNFFLLGDPAGGGIAVDERARVDVVGQTTSADFPSTSTGRPPFMGADAVRAAIDMLPVGVGRTDGTGEQANFMLPSGFSGGTTPACALSPFGKVIGQPPPQVSRILIDYMGRAPETGVTGSSILISRPTWMAASPLSVILAAFQYGFPASNVHPVILPTGLEQWVTDSPVLYGAGVMVGFESWVEPLSALPSPPVVGMPMTVQMTFWIPPVGGVGLVPSGLGPAPCTFTHEFTATPALWMNL